jgi:hypothetical protein
MTPQDDGEKMLYTQPSNGLDVEMNADTTVSSLSHERPFSIFTTTQKWCIVALISFVGLFRFEISFSSTSSQADPMRIAH